MDVAVSTVVKDSAGKQKRNANSTVRFLFRGYNGESQRWSFRSSSGMFSTRILHDSLGGNFALMDAFTALAPRGADTLPLIIDDRPAGTPFVVRSANKDCHDFTMTGQFTYPDKKCPEVAFYMGRDPAGELSIERFTVDVGALPALGKVPYLGDAQVLKIHADGEVQQARLPDDPKPFLIPKRVTTTIESDRGTVTVTNAYTLAAQTARKK